MVFEKHDFKKFPELSNRQMDEFQFMSPHPQITDDFEATVVRVHDGDTVTLRTNFRDFDFPLRMRGLDAPELNAGGHAARDWLKAKIEGAKVYVEIDRKNRVDKYGRLLGRILHGGLDVGEEEVHLGLAPPFDERGEELPSLAKLFDKAQYGIE